MKKMLKIMAMLLVISTVIFAAGCADKETEGATEEVTDETPVAGDEAPEADGAEADVPADDDDANATVDGDDANATADDDDANATVDGDDADAPAEGNVTEDEAAEGNVTEDEESKI